MQPRLTIPRASLVLAAALVAATALFVAVVGPRAVIECGSGWVVAMTVLSSLAYAPLLIGLALGGLGFAAAWPRLRSLPLWLCLATLAVIFAYVMVAGAEGAHPVPSDPHSCVL